MKFEVLIIIMLGLMFIYAALAAGERDESLQERCLAQTNSKVYRHMIGGVQCFTSPHGWVNLIK